MTHERIYDETGKKSNLWATLGPADVPGYHPVRPHRRRAGRRPELDHGPFQLTERDGKLYGRGSTDMKGLSACCLAAVPDMLRRT